jgi:hypothetical protein
VLQLRKAFSYNVEADTAESASSGTSRVRHQAEDKNICRSYRGKYLVKRLLYWRSENGHICRWRFAAAHTPRRVYSLTCHATTVSSQQPVLNCFTDKRPLSRYKELHLKYGRQSNSALNKLIERTTINQIN